MVFLSFCDTIFLTEEIDDGPDNKSNTPEESLNDKNHRGQNPVQKFVDMGHARGHPTEDGLKDMQRLEVSVNNEQDQGTGRDHELQGGTKFYPQKLIQQ
jgi:hypothetical protein